MPTIALVLLCIVCPGVVRRALEKGRREPDDSTPGLALASGVACVPHPEKADRIYELEPKCGGEDSYFINDDAGVVGVADGVGGWASQGVDPGIYSRELMRFAADSVRDGQLDPGQVLKTAHSKTTARGSTTALIVVLDGVGAGKAAALRAANLGDSGFMVLRGNEVRFQSQPQQHSFNFPFQLAAPGTSGDLPSDAEVIKLDDIQAGDVVVLGSDGLFDNMFGAEIMEEVSLSLADVGNSLEPATTAQRLAEAIARRASVYANSETRNSPFAQEARKEGRRFRGGKLDDITVVVSIVTAVKSPKAEKLTGPTTANLRSKL